MKCPNCGSEQITRSHRRGTEKITKYFNPWTPYRCKDCWSRFRKAENPFKTAGAKIGAGVAALILLILLLFSFGLFEREIKPPTVPPPGPETASVELSEPVERPTQTDVPAPVAEGEGGQNRRVLARVDTDEPSSDGRASTGPDGEPLSSAAPKPETARRALTEALNEGAEPETGGPSGTEMPLPSDAGEESEAITEVILAEIDESGPARRGRETEAEGDGRTAVGPDSETEARRQAILSRQVEPQEQPVSGLDEKSAGKPDEKSPRMKRPADNMSKKGDPVPRVKPGEIARATPTRSPKATMTRIEQVPIQSGFGMRVHANGSFAGHNAFTMENPPRLVINLQGEWQNRGKNTYPVSGDLVRRVRVGEHPGYLTVVLDLQRKIRADVLVEKSPEGYTIILKEAP